MGLTDAKLRSFRPTARTKLSDEKGLYLLGTATGSRLWRFDYRWRDPTTGATIRKTMAFGAYPEVGLAEARAKLAAAREALRRGDDPMALRKSSREAAQLTFGVVALEWLNRREAGLAQGTAEASRRVVEQKLLPVLGARPLDALTPAELLALLEGLTPGTRDKARSALSGVLRDARARGLMGGDPMSALVGVVPTAASRHRPAVQGERAIGELLRAVSRPYSGQWSVGLALRLLPLVFVRPGELRLAVWSEFEVEGAEPTWRIPAERMKMRRDHVVPLARQVVALLRDAQAQTGGAGLVLPGLKGKPIGENTLNRALRSLGYDQHTMVAHGFRSVASTRLNELGERPDLIEAQLAHVEKSASRAAYQRSEFLPERRAMMQRWADECDRLRALVAP